MHTLRYQLLIVLGLASLILIGCGGDEIRRYRVPKPAKVSNEATERDSSSSIGQSMQGMTRAEADRQVPKRMLAAIIHYGEKTWFFKVLGPEEEVAKHTKNFDRFLRSVRFDPDTRTPSWTVPDQWEKVASGSGMRFATFRLGQTENPLELSVIPLARQPVLANVNRWRGQIGLEPIDEKKLDEVTTKVQLGDATAILVDMTGRGGSTDTMAPPFAHRRAGIGKEKIAPPRPGLSYTTPEGWEEQPNPGAMRVAAFGITEGEQRAEVTVIPLPGPVEAFSNVNRWRGQIGLPPLQSDEALSEVSQTIDIAGTPAFLVELIGPESIKNRERILVILFERDGRTWFFKMKGSAELVSDNEPALIEFVESVQFD